MKFSLESKITCTFTGDSPLLENLHRGAPPVKMVNSPACKLPEQLDRMLVGHRRGGKGEEEEEEDNKQVV